MAKITWWLLILGSVFQVHLAHAQEIVATGALGVVIERTIGQVAVVDRIQHKVVCRVTGFGDLSHASVVFSPDERFAFVFGRDGGLSKLDLTRCRIDKRIVQSGNAIGGAISQDGQWVAVSNYQPGGVKIFDANTLALVADIQSEKLIGQPSKTVGLVDAPNNEFWVALFEAGAIWRIQMEASGKYRVSQFQHVGRQPYDALITPDGRYYIAGLYGEPGMALVDLWKTPLRPVHILDQHIKRDEKRPVYKMPHLEGWTFAGPYALFPAVGEHLVLVAETQTWKLVEKIPVRGQPVFVMSRPDHRQIWVNFAFPDNRWLQVIDAKTLKVVKTIDAGPGVLHMEFAPRGHEIWVSVRDKNEVQIYDTRTFTLIARLPMTKPSGIFFTDRAHKIGL